MTDLINHSNCCPSCSFSYIHRPFFFNMLLKVKLSTAVVT
ncbi:hypothetical protein SLEP1_g38967 [Rubroshorea leprosula]|uniref:Uncharacterized protein n=1 Tax=Rubroshorea leprosula TaxID=152421 RepID=A0AAV5KZ26_9ROSI|nr:hypothetical protein SLEP1_g38967 [Rubroshorea leprosula]